MWRSLSILPYQGCMPRQWMILTKLGRIRENLHHSCPARFGIYPFLLAFWHRCHNLVKLWNSNAKKGKTSAKIRRTRGLHGLSMPNKGGSLMDFPDAKHQSPALEIGGEQGKK
jgi:hypothetical protein